MEYTIFDDPSIILQFAQNYQAVSALVCIDVK